jgi:hypothetical protein
MHGPQNSRISMLTPLHQFLGSEAAGRSNYFKADFFALTCQDERALALALNGLFAQSFRPC